MGFLSKIKDELKDLFSAKEKFDPKTLNDKFL